jgi:hypothetical protein
VQSETKTTTTFVDIQNLLEAAVNNQDIGEHGNFWRGKTRDQFVALKVEGIPLLVVGDPDNSNLIKAIKPACPFGNDTPVCPQGTYPQMPEGFPAMSATSVQTIANWIKAGCPA